MPHVPLAVRKALLARVIALEEIERLLRNCADDQAAAVLRQQMEQLRVITAGELDAPRNEMLLDEYVHAVLTRAVDELAADPRLRSIAPLPDALGAIRRRASEVSCADCASPQPICDGGDFDDAIVEGQGRCVQTLKVFFETALGIAARYYERALPEIAERWPACAFSTTYVRGKAHPFACAAQVSGRTVHGAPAQIELIVEPRSFDWRAYTAIPYVLVHEAFHVPEGSDGSNPQPPDREDPFAEGWMDWIAYMALREALKGDGPAADLGAAIEDVDDVLESAALLHTSRYDYPTSDVRPVSQKLLTGRRAAETFFELCQRFIESDEEAWSFFLAISLRLNLRQMTLNQHRSIVAKVNAEIPKRRNLGTPTFARTARELRKYFETRDITRLTGWLCD